jgi:hypothetical protein
LREFAPPPARLEPKPVTPAVLVESSGDHGFRRRLGRRSMLPGNFVASRRARM